MKTKMISFIFLMAFVMTAVHCDPTDAKEFDCQCLPDTPSLVPEGEEENQIPPPSNSSDSEADESDDYDYPMDLTLYGTYNSLNESFDFDAHPDSENHYRQIFSSLLGLYQNDNNLNPLILDIRPDSISRIVNGEQSAGNYTVEFRDGHDSYLSFEINGVHYGYFLDINYTNNAVIGIRHLGVYFHKVENNANGANLHDEH